MKINDNTHLENEVKLTLENTEVLYNTALHMDRYDFQGSKDLTEEVVAQMIENGVEIDNFVNTVDIIYPYVVNTIESIKLGSK